MVLKENYKGCGVYKITSPNGRNYIGSSNNIYNRHRYYTTYGAKKQTILNRSFIKYGIENHSFEILIKCSYSEKYSYERYFGDLYNVIQDKGGLNLRLPSTNELPTICSSELRKKFSIISSNRKYSKETLKKFSDAKIGVFSNGKHSMAKIVINIENGIFYECVKEAAESLNIKRSTLSMKLTNRNRNNTPIRYA